jgi:hypothetical protein
LYKKGKGGMMVLLLIKKLKESTGWSKRDEEEKEPRYKILNGFRKRGKEDIWVSCLRCS